MGATKDTKVTSGKQATKQATSSESVRQEQLVQTARFIERVAEGRPSQVGWDVAATIVNKVRPVPSVLWVPIRAVYGKAGVLGEPDSMAFLPVGPLLRQAGKDKTLSRGQAEAPGARVVENVAETVELLGTDVAASLCFIHAVCRRVRSALENVVWSPILDDALLRAHIGYYVGQSSPAIGPGRGMLAGFAARCGLAVQIASGTRKEAEKALTEIAAGKDLTSVCLSAYACDPLQVAALTLISAGCHHDIAMGIAAYNSDSDNIRSGADQYLWLLLFKVVEQLRLNRSTDIDDYAWAELKCDTQAKISLIAQARGLVRRGHGWQWVTEAQTALGAEGKGEGEVQGG